MRYMVDPERSTLIIDARSNIGPISWEAIGVEGELVASFDDGELDLGQPVTGELVLHMHELRSGNDLYDAELQRRIDARLHPTASATMLDAVALGGGRYQTQGRLQYHGVERETTGTLEIQLLDDVTVMATGEQVIDIRDFNVPAPTMLMLKIYPDVVVRLVAVGTTEGGSS